MRVAVLHLCPGTQFGAPHLKQFLEDSKLVGEELLRAEGVAEAGPPLS